MPRMLSALFRSRASLADPGLTGARMEAGSARRALARMAVVTVLSLVGSGAAIGTAHASVVPAVAATSFGPYQFKNDYSQLCMNVAGSPTANGGRTRQHRGTAMKRQFTSETAHYATVTSPEETLSFAWDADTGVPSRFDWLTGGVAWYLDKSTPGRIVRENPNVNYYDVDLHVTTAGYEKTPNALKGKLTVNVVKRADGATFAAILEGTGSAWLVAEGTLADVG